MKHAVRIFQIADPKKVPYAFLDHDGMEFDMGHYQLVGSVELDDLDRIDPQEFLEQVFTLGNIGLLQKKMGKPMRSLSTSDLIEVDGKLWYINSVGFYSLSKDRL